MKISRAALWISLAVAVLAAAAAGFGLVWQAGSGPFEFATVHGKIVQIHGEGLYRFDTPIAALGSKAGDIITLCLAIPLLIVSAVLYRRGSFRGGLFLSGAFAYFLYTYGSLSLGIAYNNLFLLYVCLFGLSLFGLIIAARSFDLTKLAAQFSPRIPRHGVGVFCIVSGTVLALVWLALSIIPALLRGTHAEEAEYYTTFITGVIDVGVLAPALIVSGILLIRRAPLGYLWAATLLVFTMALGPSLTLAGIFQVTSGAITLGQAMAFAVPFVILTLVDIWFTIAMYRR
jgi:hypothetical protein